MVLDTNILIAYFAKETRVVATIQDWFSHGRPLFISAVTYAEALSLREASPAHLADIRSFLDYFIVVDVNKGLAEEVATIRREYRMRFADAAIAATALLTRTPLVTRDKQFRKITGIEVIRI